MVLAQMIRDRDDYDEMKPHILLGKLQQHEMADQAAIKAAERVPNAIMPNIVGASKGVALKAKHEDEHNNQVNLRSNNASKSKEVVESSTSEDDSSNDEDQDVAMFIKSFKRIIKGGNKFRRNFSDKQKRRNKKRPCYECGEFGHFIAECPKKKNEGKKEWRKDKYKKEAAEGVALGAITAYLMESGRGHELNLPKGAKLELELERALYLVKE